MANKLQNVFNKNDHFIKGTIRFQDEKASADFQKALESVYEKGSTVRVNGVASMSMHIDSGAGAFPMENFNEVTDIVIGPSPDEVNLDIEIDGEIIKFPIVRYSYKNGAKILTKEDFVFSTVIIFDETTRSANVSIKPSLDKATDVNTVLRDIKIEIKLMRKFFRIDSGKETGLDTTLTHLNRLYKLFDKLDFIEKTFNKRFIPGTIDLDNIESIKDLIEICLLLREKNVIRKNAKLTDATGNGLRILPDNEVTIGQNISITFIWGLDYLLWGEKIELHCSNLLCNAVVKKIENLDDGKIRILYGENDGHPMYISYKGFIDSEDAKVEHDHLMEHKEDYENAKTVEQYIDEGY